MLIISKVPAHWVYLNNAFTEIVHDGFVTISSADTAEKLGPDPSSKTISIVFDRSSLLKDFKMITSNSIPTFYREVSGIKIFHLSIVPSFI